MKADLSIIDTQIFSKMKKAVTDLLPDKALTNANFSTTDRNPNSAVFPFVYFDMVDGTETSSDLEGDTFNGGLYTFQVVVYNNTSQADTKIVMDAVKSSMKLMGFRMVSIPISGKNDSVFYQLGRFQRSIDNNDEL